MYCVHTFMIDVCSLTLPESESVECQTCILGKKNYEHKIKWPSIVRGIN